MRYIVMAIVKFARFGMLHVISYRKVLSCADYLYRLANICPEKNFEFDLQKQTIFGLVRY